ARAAPRPRSTHPRRRGESARRLRGPLLHRLPLYVRPGAPSRPRLRDPLPPHGGRARAPAPGPLPLARRMKRAAVYAAVAALLVVPAFLPFDYYVNIASQILIAGIFAGSLNLLAGYG